MEVIDDNLLALGILLLADHQRLLCLGIHHHARRHLCPKGAQRYGGALGLQPGMVVVAWLVPTRQFLTGIIFLAVVFVVRADRAIGRYLPLLVGRDTLGGAVGKLDEDVDATLRQSEDRCLVGLVLAHGEQPAVAQHQSDAVFLLQSSRDVVGVVEHRLAVVRRHGHQDVGIVTDAVDVELMQSDAGHIGDGALDGLVQLELLADVAGCQSGVQSSLLAGHQPFQTNPAPCPVALLQQTDAEALLLAPRTLAGRRPDLHFPRALRGALQRLSAVAHPQLLVRVHLAGVPHLALVGRDDNLVGRLAHVLLVASDEPREPRCVGINAQRTAHILYSQPREADVRNSCFLLACHQHRQ